MWPSVRSAQSRLRKGSGRKRGQRRSPRSLNKEFAVCQQSLFESYLAANRYCFFHSKLTDILTSAPALVARRDKRKFDRGDGAKLLLLRRRDFQRARRIEFRDCCRSEERF